MNPAPGAGSSAPETPRNVAVLSLLRLIFNALLFALFAWLFAVAGELPDSRWEPLGAGAFPRLVLGVLMALTAIAVIGQLLRLRGQLPAAAAALPDATVRFLISHRLVLAVLAGFGVYVAALPWLGFAPASFLFLLGIQLLIGPKTRRNLIIGLLIALAGSWGLELLFREVFTVFLPRGRLFV